MNVLFLSCDAQGVAGLSELADVMQEKKHSVFVVAPTLSEEGYLPWIHTAHHNILFDVPGHGWLPFEVNDMDAHSYLLKRNIHAIILSRTDHELIKTFVECTNRRPGIVLVNPIEVEIPAYRQSDCMTIRWGKRISAVQRSRNVRRIIKFVASRP